MIVDRSATAGVEAEKLGDIKVVELAVAVGVARDKLIHEQVNESGNIVEVELPVGVVVGGARGKTGFGCHRLDVESGIECAGDDTCVGVHLVDDAVGAGDVEHVADRDGCVRVGVDGVGAAVVDSAFELVEEVDGSLFGPCESNPGEVHGVTIEGHGLDEGATGSKEEEVVLADMGAHRKRRVPADEQAAGIEPDGGDIGAQVIHAVHDLAGIGVDVVDSALRVGNNEFVAQPSHRVEIGVVRECASDQIGAEIVFVDDPVVIAQVEGVVVNGHRVHRTGADTTEGDLAADGVEGMDCALRAGEEDGVCVCCIDRGDRGDEYNCSWDVDHSSSPDCDASGASVTRSDVLGDDIIFVGESQKPLPLFGGFGRDRSLVGSVAGSGTPDELGEQLAAGRDLEVPIDRENLIVDGGTSDIEMESDLFFRIAHQEAPKDFASSLGERAEQWFVCGGEVVPDFTIDDHVQQRDDGVLAGCEISRADAFMEPEGGASIRDRCWAHGDDVVVNAAHSVNLVERVRAVPGLSSPDLIPGEHEGLAGELGEVRVFGSAFDGDGLGVVSPAMLGFVRDPAVAVGAQIPGFLLVAGSEVFDFRADDDLRLHDGAQLAEQQISPRVNIGTKIAAAGCDLVTLVDISGGEFGKHAWMSVPRLGLNPKHCFETLRLSVELRRVFVPAIAAESSVCCIRIVGGHALVCIHDIAQVFKGERLYMPVAESGVRLAAVPWVWSGAMLIAAVSPISEVVVVGHPRWIQSVAVPAFGAESGFSQAVAVVLGTLGLGLARGGAHRIREHQGVGRVETGCADGEVDEALRLVIVHEAGVAEEMVVIPESVVAGVSPLWYERAEEYLAAIDAHGVLVFTIGAGIGERVETRGSADDGEPAGPVLLPIPQLIDIAGFVGVSPGLSWDRDVSVGVGVDLPACSDLTHAGCAEQGFCGTTGAGERREQDPDQKRNDRDDDQEFDQGECVSVWKSCIRTVHRIAFSPECVHPFHEHCQTSSDFESDGRVFGPICMDACVTSTACTRRRAA